MGTKKKDDVYEIKELSQDYTFFNRKKSQDHYLITEEPR
jgi:hypothetical protein